MMPMALVLLWVELCLLDHLFVEGDPAGSTPDLEQMRPPVDGPSPSRPERAAPAAALIDPTRP